MPLALARPMAILVGSSHCIHLIHAPLGPVLIRPFGVGPLAGLPNPVMFVAMVLITIGVSMAVHLLIEKPATQWLRRPGRRAHPAGGVPA